jgi:high-affinity nickel-transport protein
LDIAQLTDFSGKMNIMENLPANLPALLALVFVLGLRHGLDPDHLATIDGLTRFNAAANRGVARWCGMLFSLGHGAIVMAVALSVGLLAHNWAIPDWLEDLGAWISIVFLGLLGLLNLAAVLRAPPGQVVQPLGLKGRLLGRLQHTSHPALVGALFALSFDTVSQTALFSITAAGLGGWGYSLLMGATFMSGMMATDGINGLWIARLIRSSDQLACYASRVMSLTVALLSLLVAGFGVARYFSPDVAAWSEGKNMMMGLSVVAVVASSFLLARLLARRTPAMADGRH